MEGAELEFRDDAIEEIAVQAIKKKTGARGLRSIMEASLKDVMFELPSIKNLQKVIIDKSVIKDKTKPFLVYAKKSQHASN